jgi:hypothetical protein
MPFTKRSKTIHESTRSIKKQLIIANTAATTLTANPKPETQNRNL